MTLRQQGSPKLLPAIEKGIERGVVDWGETPVARMLAADLTNR
jgi:hypothetical protein